MVAEPHIVHLQSSTQFQQYLGIFAVPNICNFFKFSASPVGPMVFHVNATSTNITVSWYLTTFSTNPPSMYAIEVQQGRVASDRWDIVHNQSALAITNATVGNFRPFNWYCVRVVAVFSDGERVGSSVHTVMTSEDRPWGPPTNVKVSTFNETTLQVRWEVS